MVTLCLVLLQATAPDCIMRGKTLPDHLRSQFLCLQKRMTYQRVPHHAQRAIDALKKNSLIIQGLAPLTDPEASITWKQLEEQTQPLILLGFGSLMHTKSNLNRHYQPNINIPCIAFGVKRIYSLIHPTPQTSCAGLPSTGHKEEQLQLTTHITGNANDYANGILLKFELHTPAYNKLKDRERPYHLIPIKAVDYRSIFGSPRIIDAYILSSQQIIPDYHKKPHVLYNQTVLMGAQIIENEGNAGFVPLFLDTTYLPDGVTTVRQWLKQQHLTNCS